MGIDLALHRPATIPARTVVEPGDLSRFAGVWYRVSELPELMADPCPRGHYRPLIQFIKDWNYWVDRRGELLDGPPPVGGDRFHLASIAAVVHALTARDGVEVPAWVHLYTADPERTMSGIPVTTNFGRLVKEEAPPTCAQHGVYFEKNLLDR